VRRAFSISRFIFSELDQKDKDVAESMISKNGKGSVTGENEAPWAHGKREIALDEKQKDSLCSLVYPEQLTTGNKLSLYFIPLILFG